MASSHLLDQDEYTALCSAITLQSHKEGFFQQIVNNVMSSVGECWLDNFGKLESNAERIRECLTHERMKEYVYQMMDNVQEVYRGKSVQISASRRQEADHLFAAGKTERALIAYTQSIIRAPVADADKNKSNESSTLALALWGRSKVLYHLKKISFCLEDVKLVLKEKISHHLKLDAYWMMAKCYIRLEQLDRARITLNVLAKLAVGDERWTKKVKSKLEELPPPTRDKCCDRSAPNLGQASNTHKKPTNTIFENVTSSKLNFSRTEQAGKFFVAGENIETGETLVVEDPFVSCLLPEKFGTHCQNCLRRLVVAVPCENCSAVVFCDVTCRSSAQNTFHKFECRFLDLLIGSGMSILCFAALRILSQQNSNYFLNADLRVEGQTGEHAYTKVHNMVVHDKMRTAFDFLSRTLMALFLLAVLKKSGYFPSSKETTADDIGHEEIFIAGVLLRNLEVLQFNAHEISEAVAGKDSKSVRTVNIGIGLYLTASTFNHDCFPSISRYFNGSQLIIKAIRPVSKGALVGDNYGPIYTRVKLEERRMKLKSRYWFECRCTACSEDWPTLNNLDSNTCRIKRSRLLKVYTRPDVSFRIPIPKNLCMTCKVCNTFHLDTNVVDSCTKCQKPVDKTQLNELMKILNEHSRRSVDELREEQISEICRTLDLLDAFLCPPHKIYAEVSHKLTQFWMYVASLRI